MPPTTNGASERKPKKDRACDACRRRKTKCDGASMHNQVCSNCIQTRKPCTYVEVSKPRGPPKAYITSLEDRVEALEAILRQTHPDQDFSDELGPPVIRGSWKALDGSLDAPSISVRRKSPIANNVIPPLLIPYRTGKHKDTIQNQLSAKSNSPRSTHLIFRSKLPSKRMRVNMDEGFTSSEGTSDDSSSSEQVEETVITSLDGREKIFLFASENDDTPEENLIRFHGRSSTAGLIETTRQFKHMHIRDVANLPEIVPEEKPTAVIPDNLTVAQWRRPVFWKRPTWEYSHEIQRVESLKRLRTFLEYFPPQDLANTLIDLYFTQSNSIFPLLHRPTFMRQWKDRLHHRNIWFTGVCLVIFAIGSRWCDDQRILPQILPGEDSKPDWRRAGRRYYEIVVEIYLIRQSFFHPTNLFEVQTFTLLGIYLRTTDVFPTAWLFTSVGLRKVQDVGAHRKKVYRSEPNADDELWKRVFWLLVVLDRIGGVGLGRACGISEEDFDLDLPLEVDDEYWETNPENFKQPPGIPSNITAFIQLIKLTQIMAFTMRTLYAINKSQIYNGTISLDTESLTKQTSLAMNEWLERLPEHIQWRNKIEKPAFRAQSACLISLYYLTQMLIWRPLIARASINPQGSAKSHLTPLIADSAIVHCTEAARECAHIVEAQLHHGIDSFYIPGIITMSYVCAGLLLLHAWNQKIWAKESTKSAMTDLKPPLAHCIERDVTSVKTFMCALEAVKERWDIVDMLLDELQDALDGLTSQLKKSRSSSHCNVGLNKESYCSDGRSQHSQPPSGMEKSNPPTRYRRKSQTALSRPFPFPESELGVYSTAFRAQLETAHTSDTKSRRSSTNNTTSEANLASWRERDIPYISSMRRTSSSNLHARKGLYPPEGKDLPSGGVTLSTPESVRYDDVHSDALHLGAAQYMEERNRQQGECR